jgi:hypothetical protein
MRLAVFMLVAVALWSMPGDLGAQVINCPCNHFTVKLDPAVACRVGICYQVSPLGPIVCSPVQPGDSLIIPCPVYAAGVRLCDGSIFYIFRNTPFPDIGACTRILQIAPGCCVRACRVKNDPAGCPVISVQPAPCPVPGC